MPRDRHVVASRWLRSRSGATLMCAMIAIFSLSCCRDLATNRSEGNDSLTTSAPDSAADHLQKLAEGQRIEVSASALAQSCIGEAKCLVQMSDGPEESLASVVVGLNAETFATLKAQLADLQQESSALALSGEHVKPKYTYCRPPTLSFPIPDLSSVNKFLMCELGNYPEMLRESLRRERRSELREMDDPFPGRLRSHMRKLACENRTSLSCRTEKLFDGSTLLGD